MVQERQFEGMNEGSSNRDEEEGLYMKNIFDTIFRCEGCGQVINAPLQGQKHALDCPIVFTFLSS